MLMYPFLVLLAFVYANFLEWSIHKYLFHGLGKNKKSFFASHWSGHHQVCRKNENFDESYTKFPPDPSVLKELFSLFILNLIHFPLYFISPFFYLCLSLFSVRYFYMHQRGHLDVEWGKKNMPWHYDHHMGKDQDSNWGVTNPLWDNILGTRKPWTPQKKNSE